MSNSLTPDELIQRAESAIRLLARNLFLKSKNRIRIWKRLPLRSQLYRAGLITTFAFMGVLFALPRNEIPRTILISVSLIFYAAGFLSEVATWISTAHKWSEKNIIAKGVTAGILAMAATTCATHASSIVNKISNSAQNPLPYTTALLTIPSALLIAIFALSILFLAIFAHTNIVSIKSAVFESIPQTIKTKRKKLKDRRLRRKVSLSLLRIAGGTIVISQSLIYSSTYNRFLEFSARFFAFNFEMAESDPCIRGDERIARINEDVVLVGTRFMWDAKFQKRLCRQDSGASQ